MEKTNLLLIDIQNDFCDPRGSLSVQGAFEDSKRLAAMIHRNLSTINNIYITLDSHHNYDIAHPLYWVDGKGNHPDPFTVISREDLESGKWKTTRTEDRIHGEKYVRALEERGKYSLCIWPPHCLIGSWGTQIQDDVFRALCDWEMENVVNVNKIYKGINPRTEHYGAFEAEVPLSDDPKTHRLSLIAENITKADRILIAGQALDYCVANSVRQIADSAEKMYLFEDCCSSVDPSADLSEAFWKDMKLKGMKTVKSIDY